MQLNKQTDYALRALVFLATQEGLSTIDDISEKFSIARNHLTKIISRLAKLNYVTAIRGKGGGLKLNPQALKISLAEIAKNFESTFNVIDCEGLSCPLHRACGLEVILGEASRAFVNVLESYHLNDILPQTKHQKLKILKRLDIKKAARNDG